MFFHPLFQTALIRWLGGRRRRTSPAAGERKRKCPDRHADGCENRCDGNSSLTKQGANALSQCGVFMEKPHECLIDSVDLGPEGCSIRGEDFEPCLSFNLNVREYTLELSDSVSNLSHSFEDNANLGTSLIRIGHSARPWVSKGCGNLWSSPTILAASTRTSSCLSGSQTLANTM